MSYQQLHAGKVKLNGLPAARLRVNKSFALLNQRALVRGLVHQRAVFLLSTILGRLTADTHTCGILLNV